MMRSRLVPPEAHAALIAQGLPPLLARVYAARGVRAKAMLGDSLDGMLTPDTLKGIDASVQILSQAIDRGERILIIADYDCDGATACAVAVRGQIGRAHV